MSLLASILIKVTITTALALVGARLARHSRAAVRHLILAAAFVILLVLPIAAAFGPSIRVPVLARAQNASSPSVIDALVDVIDAQPTEPAQVGASAPSSPTMAGRLSMAGMLFAAWLLGVALCLWPVVMGCWRIRSLRRSGLPWQRGQAMAVTRDRRVDVLLHESVPGPMTCGILRPCVMLPIDSQTWTDEDLRRALVHELEHVRRRDWVSQCLARMICACYWFHPMVWMAQRQLALEAERACDDAVLLSAPSTALRAGADPSLAYADQLVSLAQRLSGSSNQPQLAMASRHDLAARVVAVLDNNQQRGRAGALRIVAAAVVSTLLLATVSPLRIVARSQDPVAPLAQPAARYEAASIKPCAPDEAPLVNGRARGTAGGTNASTSPGRFNVPCVTVEQLIYLAYASYGAREGEHLANDYLGTASNDKKVRGGPSWVHSQKEKYAIEATAPGVTDRFVLAGTMLRTLLEERFRLKIHRETENVPMMALRVAKSGFKLKPMKEGDCEEASGPPPWPKQPCGFMTRSSGTVSRLHYVSFRLSFLARVLSEEVRLHVIDETGISGEFLIDLQFVSDDMAARAAGDPLGAELPGAGATLFTALEQQLGLKLEKTTGPSGFIVIDSIERPTPDGPIVLPPQRARGAGPR